MAYFKQAAFPIRLIFIFAVTDWKSIPSHQPARGQQKETSPTPACTQIAAEAPNAGGPNFSFPQHRLLVTVPNPPNLAGKWPPAHSGALGALSGTKSPRGLAAPPGAEWRPLGGSLPEERRGTKGRFLPRRAPPAPGEGARGSSFPAWAECKAERRHCSGGSSPIDGNRCVHGLLIPSLFAYGK